MMRNRCLLMNPVVMVALMYIIEIVVKMPKSLYQYIRFFCSSTRKDVNVLTDSMRTGNDHPIPAI